MQPAGDLLHFRLRRGIDLFARGTMRGDDEILQHFGIGGIDASNLDQLVAVGVDRACVIRAVGDAPDPEQATRKLRAMLGTC